MNKWKEFKFDKTGYTILCITERYRRTASGKCWKSKPYRTTYDVITATEYNNYVTSVPWFNNFGNGASCRCYPTYTVAGYIPARIVTVAPLESTRTVHRFRFLDNRVLLENAGCRERRIVENAVSFEYISAYDHDDIRFITHDDTAIYDTDDHIWKG